MTITEQSRRQQLQRELADARQEIERLRSAMTICTDQLHQVRIERDHARRLARALGEMPTSARSSR